METQQDGTTRTTAALAELKALVETMGTTRALDLVENLERNGETLVDAIVAYPNPTALAYAQAYTALAGIVVGIISEKGEK